MAYSAYVMTFTKKYGKQHHLGNTRATVDEAKRIAEDREGSPLTWRAHQDGSKVFYRAFSAETVSVTPTPRNPEGLVPKRVYTIFTVTEA